MSLSELSWLGPNTNLLLRTVPRIVSHLLAFATLHLIEVFPVGFGVGVLTTVFSHNVLISEVINLLNMDGAMVAMVEVVVIFSMKVVQINIMTMVVVIFKVFELKMNAFIIWSVPFLL